MNNIHPMYKIRLMDTQPFYSRLRVLRDEAAEEIRAKIRKLIKWHLTDGTGIGKSHFYSSKAEELFVEKVSNEFKNTEYAILVRQANLIYNKYFRDNFLNELQQMIMNASEQEKKST